MRKPKSATSDPIAPPWKLSFGKIVDSEGRKVCNLIRRSDMDQVRAIARLIVLAPSLLPLLHTALDALVEHGDESTEPWIREQLEKLTGQ